MTSLRDVTLFKHETHPLLLHIVCICNKTNLFNIAWIPTKCCWVMDIFCKILSNFLNTVGPPMTFQFACIFQRPVQYWMRFKIHSWVWTEAQSVIIIIIIYSMQADISNASKIKRKQWMAATLWFRSTSLKTTLISVEQESAQWHHSQVHLDRLLV